ncbi:MAG TPA: ThuA domain-containing protein [Vicinamibacterales bacterium]|nr:ThuA domain-containing protein [Vicinamibacterales bacterium]
MRRTGSAAAWTTAVCAAVLLAAPLMGTQGQPAGRGGGGGGRGGVAPGLFTATDANKDGAVTREEMKATFERWFTEWDTTKAGALSQEELLSGLNAALPPQQFAGGAFGGGRGAQNQTPNPSDVQAMMAALPETAPAKPRQPRKVLVLGRAAGFVHSSIPLAARTVEEMGKKTGAWSTTITYDAADINEANLKQYDAIFLASTTGAFLDDPNDAAATAARRKALLDFVRNGKGLAGIHAATDSYHQNRPLPEGEGGRAGRGGGRGGRGGAAAPVVTQLLAQGDRNADQRLSREEFTALAEAWFDKIDTTKAGRVSQADFPQRFAAVLPPPSPPTLGPTGFPIQQPAAPEQRVPDRQTGTWPEFNQMIGGFFKFHWNDGQEIWVKVEEPDHPLNAAFKGKPQLKVIDETYTFGRETYSRENLRVLTSVDYDKMSAEDKAKEQYPRDDGDYALSWIRREGKGRVFYEAHGHNEKVYAIRPILEHVLAGIQYVLGDLEADATPSKKPGTR